MQKIGIIGIGKLGLCLALNLEKAGFDVIGIDLSQEYVDLINTKKLSSPEPYVSEMLLQSKNLKASIHLSDILSKDVKIIFVLVPTTANNTDGYDHHYLDGVMNSLVCFGIREEEVLLVISSTTMPGYCDSLAKRLEPHNYHIIYNPEFIAQGRVIYDQTNMAQVIFGSDNPEKAKILERIYDKLNVNAAPKYYYMSRKSAELTKIATNCFLTTKIAFANSIGDLATSIGADPDLVLDAIGADPRIGSEFLKYGFGYGGPCLPRDNRALSQIEKEGLPEDLLLSEAVDHSNKAHLEYQLKQFQKKYNTSEIIIFDQVTYKKGTPNTEESQQLALAINLAKQGYRVKIVETQNLINTISERFGDLFEYEIR